MTEQKAYKVRVVETLVKEVVVYAESSGMARLEAQRLHTDGVITLDYDNYGGVDVEIVGLAAASDMEIMDVYD